MEFPKQKIQANNSKSVLKPNRRIHIRPKHKCRSVFSLLFLLIKLAPLISVSSVTEVSVLLRRLYSTEVLSSVCHKNFGVRGKFVRQAISLVWLKVTSAAHNRSIFYFACAKFVTRFSSNWKSSRLSSILREFRGNQTCEQLTCFSFVLFFCFSSSGFKCFGTLVANIRSTSFLGSSFFLERIMLPTAVLIKSCLICGEHI